MDILVFEIKLIMRSKQHENTIHTRNSSSHLTITLKPNEGRNPKTFVVTCHEPPKNSLLLITQ